MHLRLASRAFTSIHYSSTPFYIGETNSARPTKEALGPRFPRLMSGLQLPARPSDLLSRLSSPPPRLSNSTFSSSTAAKTLISTLPAREGFALPSRPTFAASTPASTSASTRRPRRESLSPVPRYREEDDTYRPPASPRRNDTYIAPASPPRRERDTYEPEYRRRSPSPVRPRYRSYYSQSASERSVSRSLSPVKARARSPPSTRTISPERSPPPANFITQSQRWAEAKAAKQRQDPRKIREEKKWEQYQAKKREQEERLEAERIAREEKEKLFAEERARKQKLFELRQQRIKEEASKSPVRWVLGSCRIEFRLTSSVIPAKRSAEPSAEPASKVAKAIPTGPRGSTFARPPPTAPSGPRGNRPIPTGPSGPRVQPVASSPVPPQPTPIAEPTPTPQPPSRSPSPVSDSDMPSSSRSRGRGRTPTSNGGGGKKGVQALPLPEYSYEQIMQLHGKKVTLKAQWAENPKAPLANYLGNGTGGASDLGQGGGAYEVQEGLVGAKRMFRWVITGATRWWLIR